MTLHMKCKRFSSLEFIYIVCVCLFWFTNLTTYTINHTKNTDKMLHIHIISWYDMLNFQRLEGISLIKLKKQSLKYLKVKKS